MIPMLSQALLAFMSGPLKQLVINMGGKNGAEIEAELNKFNRGEPCWVPKNPAAAPVEPSKPKGLLETIGTVPISATTAKFVARKKFVRDIGSKAKVKIAWIGDNFKAMFLAGKGKIEDKLPAGTLRYDKLRQSSVSGSIIEELGGEAKAETTLTELYDLLLKQANGEAGALLTNGWWNIFYVRDSSGVLRAVFVYWYGDGWFVSASAVENPFRWFAGFQVFSRHSCLPLETGAA